MGESKPSLRIRLSNAAEREVRKGHPWVFESSIRSQNREGTTGELGIIFDKKNTFMAIGLYDAKSPIRLRVLHCGMPRPIDAAFWGAKIEQAIERRQSVVEAQTTGLRWIYGENDGWPGLILDGYADSLVLKIYTAAWLPYLETLVPLFQNCLGAERLVFRHSRNMEAVSAANHYRDGQLLVGEAPDGPVRFQESGIWFYADLIQGQKTGFFLDQRENRRRVEALAQGHEVLNCFSFSGGFSLYAARGGARSVVSVDQSAHALTELVENWKLNENHSAILNCPHEEVRADVYRWLPDQKKRYGLVIIDPPSMAPRKADREKAISAYRQLLIDGLRSTEKGGTLVFCSCSAHVSKEDFIDLARDVLTRERSRAKITEKTGHAADHPSRIPELDYLKALYIQT
ncbi:MAG: class I SAM-dependent rRNA methyltransferase [Verrucomicrobiota bacterium]